ncbi:hypothetical protein B2J93_7310 [Marssonina coronariae]|uniref:NADH:flavin oxidoreductase/NADH oxidase N-terminal domain-containing protein n=1 Tax=Diplocarpon coronariae TaxID=2795749 RepID=A0A218Z252_9HELO|nr:hypothetical protein B2J93_7310 [Marssonina coronariae]
MGNSIILCEAKFEDKGFEAFNELATAAKENGSLIVGQASHPGRQFEDRLQKNLISASNVMGMTFAKQHQASQEEINRVVAGFAHAAEYLEKDLAQIFLQNTDQRTDSNGGSLENRVRLIVEVAAELRKRVSGSFIVRIKIKSFEFREKGFSPEEAKDLCQALEKDKFEFIESSGGTYESLAFKHKRKSTVKRKYFLIEFPEEIVKLLTMTKTYVTGGLKKVGAMFKALNTVDGVSIAGPACQKFELPREILKGKTTGATKMQLEDNEFGLTNVVAGTQIRHFGKDQQPRDLSVDKNLDAFMKDI